MDTNEPITEEDVIRARRKIQSALQTDSVMNGLLKAAVRERAVISPNIVVTDHGVEILPCEPGRMELEFIKALNELYSQAVHGHGIPAAFFADALVSTADQS